MSRTRRPLFPTSSGGCPPGYMIDPVTNACVPVTGQSRMQGTGAGGFGGPLMPGSTPTPVVPDFDYFINLAEAYGVAADGTDQTGALNAALAQVAVDGRHGWLPPGSYTFNGTINIPVGVSLWGSGSSTILRFPTVGGTAISFPKQFARSELANLQIIGSQAANGLAQTAGIGLDLDRSQRVLVHDVIVWDFGVGVLISNGGSFSAYHELDYVEVNRCAIGIRALANTNGPYLNAFRVFWSYTAANSGIAVDLADCIIEIDQLTVDAADTCVRVRNNDTFAGNSTHIKGDTWYLEPGQNPTTLQIGQSTDVDLQLYPTDTSGGWVFDVDNLYDSANRASIVLPAEAIAHCNGLSTFPFGGRYDGAAVAKANRVLNGDLLEWGIPNVLPNWFTAGAAPTITEETVVVFQGLPRSLRATATGITSVVTCQFQVSDVGAEWQTVGFAYQIAPGNTGVAIAAAIGANNSTMSDPVPGTGFANGAWRVRYLNVRVPPGTQDGAVNFTIDSVGGAGQILVGGVWAVTGHFNSPLTAYEQKIKLLSAPITIAVNQTTNANEVWSANLLTLPTNPQVPVAERPMAHAPRGVVGAILRFHVRVTEGAANTPLSAASIYLDIPGTFGITAAVTEFFYPQYSQRDHYWESVVRFPIAGGTTVSGGWISWVAGNDRVWDVALKAWILE